MRWSCECPLCRIFIHPILKVLVRTKEAKGDESAKEVNRGTNKERVEKFHAEELKNIEKVTQIPQVVNIAMNTASQLPTNVISIENMGNIAKNEPGEESKKEREDISGIEVKIPSEVLNKIKSLEDELTKIREYVNANINDIKSALIDIKSSIEELSSPFTMGEGSDVKEVKHVDERLKGGGAVLDPASLEDITLWLNKVLNVVGLNKLEKLIDSYVKAGILSEDLGNALRSMALVIESLISENVSPEIQLQIITGLLKLIKSKEHKR